MANVFRLYKIFIRSHDSIHYLIKLGNVSNFMLNSRIVSFSINYKHSIIIKKKEFAVAISLLHHIFLASAFVLLY